MPYMRRKLTAFSLIAQMPFRVTLGRNDTMKSLQAGKKEKMKNQKHPQIQVENMIGLQEALSRFLQIHTASCVSFPHLE